MAKKTKNVELPIAEMSVAELSAKALEIRTKIAKTQLLIRSGKSRNTREVFTLRKDLARVLVVKSAKS
ncbi:MAG: 50S ribosomal protein L29 [Patescibacteria group bacterium]